MFFLRVVLDIKSAEYNGLVFTYKYNGADNQRWYLGYDGVIRSNVNTDWCLTMIEDDGGRQTVIRCDKTDVSDLIFTIEC